MYEYEVLNLTTGERWFAYAHFGAELERKYPHINWDEQKVLGSWYID